LQKHSSTDSSYPSGYVYKIKLRVLINLNPSLYYLMINWLLIYAIISKLNLLISLSEQSMKQ